MGDFTAQDVQDLRQTASVGMMDAKKALSETGGDQDAALRLLREQGKTKVAKRAERDATEGTIGSYLHSQADRTTVGVLVELSCETDFVAKSDEFKQVARDLAMHVAWAKPRWVRIEDVPEADLEHERELIAKQSANEGKPEQIIPKIVEGKIKAFYSENVLSEQEFVKSDTFEGTVGALIEQLAAKMGENIGVRRIARLAVGE